MERYLCSSWSLFNIIHIIGQMDMADRAGGIGSLHSACSRAALPPQRWAMHGGSAARDGFAEWSATGSFFETGSAPKHSNRIVGQSGHAGHARPETAGFEHRRERGRPSGMDRMSASAVGGSGQDCKLPGSLPFPAARSEFSRSAIREITRHLWPGPRACPQPQRASETRVGRRT